MDKSKKIIELKNISKSYDGTKVLDNIHLDIYDNEFLTLLGPSGCGKTTTLRLIGGFETPDTGDVLFLGERINDTPAHKRNVNTVFQRYALFPHLNVFDNVAFPLREKKVPRAEIEEKVNEMLRLVKLTGFEKRNVTRLSGGQQQRVAIARALVSHPQVLLLDEPLGALDLKLRKDMQQELKNIQKATGITFVFVTHDQEEALSMSDTIVVMSDGKIQQIGTPTDIYNEPVNCFVADFIGESNILKGRMMRDRRVAFIKHEFDCVDEGFGEDVPVDVVVRPEDIYFTTDPAKCQFKAKVNSCTFKGVHYEMWVDTDTGYELMIQDYDPYEVGTEVMLYIDPDDIQVMRKERTRNVFEGKMTDENHVEILGGVFECLPQAGLSAGDKVRVEVRFEKVDLLDHQEDGVLAGEVHFLLYKGDHYHLTILTEDGGHIWVDTNDIWDKGDLVGINIAPEDLTISKASDEA